MHIINGHRNGPPRFVKTEKVMSKKESLELGSELKQPDISQTERQMEQ